MAFKQFLLNQSDSAYLATTMFTELTAIPFAPANIYRENIVTEHNCFKSTVKNLAR